MSALHPTEQWLQERGIDYVLVEVNLDEIDVEASHHNQVRFAPLTVDTIDQYARAMKRGDQFPPLLGRRLQNGRIILGDGNHTSAAALRVGKSTFSCFLVDCTEDVFLQLSFEANVRLNGRENTMDERKSHAINLVSRGVKPADAAHTVGLTTLQVNNALRLKDTDFRLSSLGLVKALKLPESVRRKLGQIKMDPTLMAVTKGLTSDKIAHKDLESLVPEVNALGSEQEQLIHVKSVTEWTPAKAGEKPTGRKTHISPMHSLNMHGSALMNVEAKSLRYALNGAEESTRLSIRQRLAALGEHVEALQQELR